MKKIISTFLFLAIFIGGPIVVAQTVHAQTINIQQLIRLFISLGIIPANKVAAAEAAVGLPITPIQTSVPSSTSTTTTTTVTTTVNTAKLYGSCGGNPSDVGGVPNIFWTSAVYGGKSPYQYSWSMYNDVSSYGTGSGQSSSWLVNYSSFGTKQAVLNVTDAQNNKISVSCSGTIVNIQTPTPTPVAPITSTSTVSVNGKINFNLYAVALDGINVGQSITNQLAQAAAFIAANSRFNIVYTIVSSNTPHTYAKYDCNYYGTFESQGCVALAAAQLDPNFVSSLPTANGYMFFYDLNGLHPLDGGDTYGAPYGILKEGLQRTQSSMAVDAGWWMSTDPNYTGESIILHELDNQIDSTLQKNYSCAPMSYPTDGTTGVPAEKERLAEITQGCYNSVVSNPSSI